MDEPDPQAQPKPGQTFTPGNSNNEEKSAPATSVAVAEPPTAQQETPPQLQTLEPVRPPASPQMPPRPPIEEPPAPPAAKPKKGWLKALIILVVIVLLAVGGWFAYQKFYKKNNSKSTASIAKNTQIPLIKIGIQSADYGSLYPAMSTNEYGYLINAQVFEGLVRYEDKSKIAPDLATDWTNPNDKTWLFTVKSGVKFHDGHTLTAKDVKYSLDKIIASKSDLAQTFASTIASVEVVGGNKIKIITSAPDPTLLNKLTFLYVIDSNLPKGAEPSLAGTGPYEIKPGTKPTANKVQMVAYDGYHGGKPATRALLFGSAPSGSALLNDFKDGTYDIVGSIDPAKASQFSSATKFVSAEPAVDFIGLNTIKTGPLQKKQVREAIRYAVDPLAIGKARGNEVTPLSQMIPESIPGYNPAITPYKRDVNKAKQLLTQAGYPKGVTLTFSTSGTSAVSAEIAKELKQAGITLKIDQHNNFDEFINYFTGNKVEMYNVDYTSDTLDGLDILTTAVGSNIYNSPKFTNLLNEIGNTTDQAKRLQLLQNASVIVDQDVPVVPLSTEDNLWLMDKNYAIHQDMPSSYISVYFYKVHLK